MKVLVINSGSSSLKYKLFDLAAPRAICAGLVERIGSPESSLTHTLYPDPGPGEKTELFEYFEDHTQAVEKVAALLMTGDDPLVTSAQALAAIGHRVAQGGEIFKENCIVDAKAIEGIRQNIVLAPLHNPANLAGIEAAMAHFPSVPSVAVFDTLFASRLPDYVYRYALPTGYYTKYKVRRYGFHGTSHAYVTRTLANLMGKPLHELSNIVCHLGNGSSITAVKGGVCRETSMGMTPTSGLIMGTRCGDIDPSLPAYLTLCTGKSAAQIQTVLDRESGLTGICGMNDMRDIHKAIALGDDNARLAFEMLCHGIKKYIGAYYAVLGRLDAIAFTAGIGENDADVRGKCLEGLEHLGIIVDQAVNAGLRGKSGRISTDDSTVEVWVVPTDEEFEIATICKDLVM
ncbi:acetate kinase [Desulfobacter latus]|uniref:Acetate kinase n=1 Tax=Desulfobacter latus TaxID=2292 RepID=A0A850TF48_9BACT|nr:acetate kinase [Desulfobacter latus]NWH06907.1 acetate kinase [Desulfobacter latus]